MNENINNKLKDLRKYNGITQEDLAERLEISRSKVSSWETNRREMSISEAVKLVKIYNVSLDYICEINDLSELQYVEISNRFIKQKNISLDKKVEIIESIRDSLKKDNIDEFYENYKKTQNATK